VEKADYHRGRLLWLWPHKDRISGVPAADKSSSAQPYNTNNVFLQGYRLRLMYIDRFKIVQQCSFNYSINI
jgi:hypothetical protein